MGSFFPMPLLDAPRIGSWVMVDDLGRRKKVEIADLYKQNIYIYIDASYLYV